jgi:hypothetical protein
MCRNGGTGYEPSESVHRAAFNYTRHVGGGYERSLFPVQYLVEDVKFLNCAQPLESAPNIVCISHQER